MQTIANSRDPDSLAWSTSRGVIAAAVIGNALEYYDFTVYAFFASIIGRQFFPSDTALGSLLLSVAAFGVGFLARPLGGVIIGSYADKGGRKRAMLITLMLMAVGTAIIALTPSYADIGIAAPILVVCARLIQGFAWGGEAGPTTSYLVEYASPARRASSACWQVVSQGLAVLVAGSIGVAASAMLSPENMNSWGWRIPFALGLAVVPVGLFLRRNMHETADFAHLPMEPVAVKRTHGRRYWSMISIATLLIIPSTVTVYVNSYMTSYAITLLHLPVTRSISVTMVVGGMMIPAALLGGLLADKFGRKPIMIIPCVLLMLFVYPAFVMLNHFHSVAVLYAIPAIFAALNGISAAGIITIIPESFPRMKRSTGLSLSYAIGATVFGGSTQFVVTWLIKVSGNPLAPAFYVIAACVLGLIGMFLVVETHKSDLT